MLTLVETHIKLRGVEARDFFRAAHMALFQRDLPPAVVSEDVAAYNEKGKIPPYVVNYMLKWVSSKSGRS